LLTHALLLKPRLFPSRFPLCTDSGPFCSVARYGVVIVCVKLLFVSLLSRIVRFGSTVALMMGIQATRLICQQCSAVRVLIHDHLLIGIIGGHGSAIEGTVAGQTFIDPQVAGTVFASLTGTMSGHDTALARSLSPREREILRLLARGMANSEIAARVSLSEGTVRNNVSRICAKLGGADRTQAALLAVRYGLAD